MVRAINERILLIGDSGRQVYAALATAVPAAQIVAVPTVFDGVAELVAGNFSAILTAAEPIERRPEAAVKTLRSLAAESRILLFGHPTLEPLSRKMLQFGCDDYIVTPASAQELQQVFLTQPMRLADEKAGSGEAIEPLPVASELPLLPTGITLADIFLTAMAQHPHDAPQAAVKAINSHLAPERKLTFDPLGAAAPDESEQVVYLSSVVRGGEKQGALHLALPRSQDPGPSRHFLAQIAQLMGKLVTLQDRHNGLQKLAITDELTGLYNGRYFRHFLSRIIDRGRQLRFPVTLLLFDIDNFKKYNDQFGHGMGDEILRQTAALMKRCSRDHDLVARISGDEFAVVFWDKEGPRQPRDAKTAPPPGQRVPQNITTILQRFQKLMASSDFTGLGSHGKGTLTISGGLAVFPYDAHDASTLIDAADRALMFGAKQQGKNSIILVGGADATNGT
jgi:two-component system cell cycle response regulator